MSTGQTNPATVTIYKCLGLMTDCDLHLWILIDSCMGLLMVAVSIDVCLCGISVESLCGNANHVGGCYIHMLRPSCLFYYLLPGWYPEFLHWSSPIIDRVLLIITLSYSSYVVVIFHSYCMSIITLPSAQWVNRSDRWRILSYMCCTA